MLGRALIINIKKWLSILILKIKFIFASKHFRYKTYNSTYITSRFQIAIDVKTIIIGHVFIQTKFCV